MTVAGLRMALRQLTVLPVPWHADDAAAAPAAALPWFPLVGLLIGGAVACVLLAPIPPLARAAIALALWTALTGALHEDGWMDAADAALAVVPRGRRLEILKDPHVGAHAVTALAVVLLLRFAALAAVSPVAPVVAVLCGRWIMVLTLVRFAPARDDGLGAAFARGARVFPASLVAAVCLVVLATTAGARVIVAATIAIVAGLGFAAWLANRFGGLTGDGHGAAGLATETVALLASLPLA